MPLKNTGTGLRKDRSSAPNTIISSSKGGLFVSFFTKQWHAVMTYFLRSCHFGNQMKRQLDFWTGVSESVRSHPFLTLMTHLICFGFYPQYETGYGMHLYGLCSQIPLHHRLKLRKNCMTSQLRMKLDPVKIRSLLRLSL